MFTTLFNRLISKKEFQILVVGLNDAGKSTVLEKLTHGLGGMATTTPTTGLNLDTTTYKNIHFAALDVRAQDENTQGLIFVVDGTDNEHLDKVKDELHKMLNKDELRDTTLLVFVNKSDLPNSMDAEEVIHKLGLQGGLQQRWYALSTCAKTGDGLYKGFDWLSNHLTNKMLHSASSVATDMEFSVADPVGGLTGKVAAVESVNRVYKELNLARKALDVQRHNLLSADLEQGTMSLDTAEAQLRAAAGSKEWGTNVKATRKEAVDALALTNQRLKSLMSSLGDLV